MSMTIRDYRRGGFEVDVRTTAPDGAKVRVRRKAPMKGKSGAQRWGAALERDVLLKLTTPAPPPAPPVPTLAEFAPRFIDGYARANRQKASGIDSKERALRVHLLPRFGARKLTEIQDEDIQRLKADLAHRAASTVNNALTCLNVLLRIAVEWKVIKEMPCRIKLLKVVRGPARFYDFEQYARLVEAAAKVDLRALVMVLLGGDAGLRRGEMIALRSDDLDHRLGITHVARSIWKGIEDYPKGAKARPVNMTEALRAALKANRHLRGPRVLCADDGSDVTAKMLRSWMAAAQKRAGLPATGGVHILRHTFCSHLAMRGAPAKAIQELAGHASLSTTMGYMHLSPAARQSAILLLDAGRARGADTDGDESVDAGTTGRSRANCR